MLSQGKGVSVTDENGNAVTVDLLPVPSNSSTASAVFPVDVPAAGFSTYFLQYTGEDSKVQEAKPTAANTISNSFYTLTFDQSTGRLATITNLVSGVSSNVRSI